MKRSTIALVMMTAGLLFAAADCGKSSCDRLTTFCTLCACSDSRRACSKIAAFDDQDTCQASLDSNAYCAADPACPPTSGNGATAGSGGSGTGGGATGSTVASTGSGCMNMAGCKKCDACKNGGCGVPDNATVCECGVGMAKSSLTSYTEYFDCLCGADGKGGKCGSVCSHTCSKQGTDQASCMMCLASAVSGACNAQYTACSKN